MIYKFSVRPLRRGSGAPLTSLERSLGLPDLEVWTEYYIEVPELLTGEQVSALRGWLGNSIVEEVVEGEPLVAQRMIQVAHKRGIIDNECSSIVTVCNLLGVPAIAGKVAKTYSSASPRLQESVIANFYNEHIEEIHLEEPRYSTLLPLGEYVPGTHYDLRFLDDEGLAKLGLADGRNLDVRQMRRIRSIQMELGLPEVSNCLLEALDARWSDHCSHTTWRSLGNLLDRLVRASQSTQNLNIVSMFHDNAGVWRFYGDWSIAIKAETHNGPVAISAYFGQLSKLGGVLRDILGCGLGADPIGCFEYLATGSPSESSPVPHNPPPRQIIDGTVRAIKEYGNTFGVPMISSHITFHERYLAKPFALGGAIGLVSTEHATRGRPECGDLVLLIGALTGDEGIHGASASSAGATMVGAAVQIGSPLEQVKFRKAVVELRDAGCTRAITDLGAAGLNSAAGEMGEECGVWINTALVPLKTAGLPMWRILLSETQERMLVAVSPDKIGTARVILDRHDVRGTVIGRFMGNSRYCVFYQPSLDEHAIQALPPGALPPDLGETGFDVPYRLLDDAPPSVPVETRFTRPSEDLVWPECNTNELTALLERVVTDCEISSQRSVDSQYDSTVQGNTGYGPYFGTRHILPTAYWAATPVEGSRGAVVVTTAFNPWLFELEPVRALRQMFFRVLSIQALAGVALRDMCLCDNFYTPHLEPGANEWLVAMVDELASLVREFGTPVISGKDSSAGSTRTPKGIVSVPPSVFLTALGKVPDADMLLTEQWQRAGNILVQVGPMMPSFAGTAAARCLEAGHGAIDDACSRIHRGYFCALDDVRSHFWSGSPIGPGGLAVRLVLGSLASGLGVDLDSGFLDSSALFAEHRSGAVVEIAPEAVSLLPEALEPKRIGVLTDAPGVRCAGHDFLTETVRERWLTSFSRSLA